MDSILPDSPQSKQCFKCKQWFPATSDYFTKHPQKKDGWNPSCKACKNGKPFPVKDVVPEGMKRCSKCKQIQPATNEYFARTKATKDGLFSHCKACVRDYAQTYNDTHKEEHAQYRQEHKEHINEANKQRYELYREEIRAEQKQVYDARKDKWNANRRQLRREDPVARSRMRAGQRKSYNKRKDDPSFREKRRAHYAIYSRTEHGRLVSQANCQKRRALKVSAKGVYTSQEILDQMKRQRGKCYYCHVKFSKGKRAYHVDHIVPLSRGGSNDISNLVVTCPHCNLSKHNKFLHEWARGGRLL